MKQNGTAGVAAQACADILKSYLADPAIQLRALKASELSGFELNEGDGDTSMSDTLVVAISQSAAGTAMADSMLDSIEGLESSNLGFLPGEAIGLRGLVTGTLRGDVLEEGVHSGDASGIVPSSFRVARALLARLDDRLSTLTGGDAKRAGRLLGR